MLKELAIIIALTILLVAYYSYLTKLLTVKFIEYVCYFC